MLELCRKAPAAERSWPIQRLGTSRVCWRNALKDNANSPIKFPRTPLSGPDKPKCRTINPTSSEGWAEPVIHEWELSGETWTDWHPHTEYNFVIEGQLFVEAGGTTVEVTPGDLVCVPKGTMGRYWTATYARLIAIYGPSDGEASKALHYAKLTPTQ
jgi:uncharacterized cupin superfamily protein